MTVIERLPHAELARVRAAAGEMLDGDHWIAQFVRFVFVGAFSNGVYLGLFMTFATGGVQTANLAAVVGSTVVANELHRQATFNAADRVHWVTAQRTGFEMMLVGLAVTAVALWHAQATFPGMSDAELTAVSIAASAVIGAIRFVVLRGFVFKLA